MKPVDIRNENWDSMKDRLSGDRQAVYFALLDAGGVTTRELAQVMSRAVEDVRPRVTELCQAGFAEMVDRKGHEGIYRAIPLADAQQRFEQRKAAGDQMLLKV
jgi:predicted transcriptional regulator